MENEKLKNGIIGIKKMTMTSDEKKMVFENVLKSTPPTTKSIQSPWFDYSFLFMMKKSRLVYLVLIPLIFILTGGGVVFASQDVLPDSILYPLKVKIIEPIEGALLLSAKSKAKHESKLASTRLIEAEILASKGELDVKKEKKINDLLLSHTKALSNALDQVNKTESNDDAEDIASNFRIDMNAHARILDIIAGEENENADTGDEKNQKENIDNNKEKKTNGKISNTARVGADNIIENRNKNEGQYKDKHVQKEILVQPIVVPIDQNLNTDTITTVNEIEIEKIIESDTSIKSDEIKKHSKKNTKKQEINDKEEAYLKLLDSKSSIREADDFFKTEFK